MSGNIDFAALIEPVARQLLGEPNRQLSSRDELRFGSHGSISVIIGGEKKGQWYDHENDTGGGLLAFVSSKTGRPANGAAMAWLRESGFIVDDQPPAQRRIVAKYDYHAADGTLLFQVARFDPKDFRQRKPDGQGGWNWKLGDIERVPYRLPDLIRAATYATVYITEGEKDADALTERGLIATTNPGGVGKWNPKYNAHFRGRRVVILPDNDPQATTPDGKPRWHPDGRPVLPGQDHAACVARSLHGTAASVTILMLAGLPLKGDVSDWLAAGGTAEELEHLAARAPEEKREAPPSAVWLDEDEWIEADLPKRPWVAPGYAIRGSVTLLCGPPSAMKSSLMLGWGCSIALHQDYGGFRPIGQAPVIIYNVEDDQTEQRRRLSAVLRQFGATPQDIKGKVLRTGPNTIGTLVARDERGALHLTPAMQRLEELITERKPAAVIVDPLAELHTAEENDNTALRAVIATFRDMAVRHNIAVIVLHHTRKGAGTSPGDPDIARGASAIIGAVRIALTLTGMSEEDARAFGLNTDAKARSCYVRLDDAKQNYAAIRDAQWFEKVPYPLDNGETVPAAVPWTPPAAKVASQTDLSDLAAGIEKGAPNGEPWSPKLSSDQRSIRSLLDKHGFHGDAQKTTLDRLQKECGVQIGRYWRAASRYEANGLHIDHKPAAKWVET